MVIHFKQATETALLSAGVDECTADSVRTSVREQLTDYNEPLNFLSSTYKQDVYFDSHSLAVKPETVDFGPRYETSRGVTRIVYDSFQYVSIESTLRSLMQDENYVQLLLDDKYTPGILRDYQDGRSFRNHVLFSDSTKFSLMLQLFYDGLGTTNPLRGQSVMCNVGMFYYVIKNLPPFCNSCYANVHLLALCYSEDLKKYGI